jgi:polysaccharide lyase-like protein
MSFAVRSDLRVTRPLRQLCAGSLLALVASACSAPADDADGPPDFTGVTPGAAPGNPGAAAPNAVPPAAAGASPAPTPANGSEPAQQGGAPIATNGNMGTSAGTSPAAPAPAPTNMGAGGSSMVDPSSSGGGQNMPPAAPEPGTPAPAPATPVPGTPAPAPATPEPGTPAPLPTPPGDAFFLDDFESSTVGQAPPNWDYFVAYVANQNNPSGNASALVDDTRAVSGTHSVHFVGGASPAQITLPLPAGTNRLFVRAQVFMTRQLGAQNNPMPNHETLIGIRGTPGQASNEVRFGEIKGVIGTNEVPSDNISPHQDQWGMGPAVAPNEWHCMEIQFLGDIPAMNELHAFVDGELVHEITAADQWQNGNLGGNWMAGKFIEVFLGWQSFSNIQTDVWMDDIVLSTSPIGCN